MNSLCRICSRSNRELLVPLDTSSEICQLETILSMLVYCTQLKVRVDDKLPQQICIECQTKLEWSYQFRKLCHKSEASFQQMLKKQLQQNNDDDSGSEVEVEPLEEEVEPLDSNDVGAAEPEQDDGTTLMYYCCFRDCKRRSSDWDKVMEHARNKHPRGRKHNQARRDEGGKSAAFVCPICLTGFDDDGRWSSHREVFQGHRGKYPCGKCNKLFFTAPELTSHRAKDCGKEEDSLSEEEEEADQDEDDQEDPRLEVLRKKLLAAIKTGDDDLIRINAKERRLVLSNSRGFLVQFNRNEMKNSDKHLKLIYVCSDCGFKAPHPRLIHAHMAKGFCEKHYWLGLGFLKVNIRLRHIKECRECAYRSSSCSNFRRHQAFAGHYGTRKVLVKLPELYKEYPCKYCTKVLKSRSYHKRHMEICSRKEHREVVESRPPRKQYPCKDCGKILSSLSNRYRHMRQGCPKMSLMAVEGDDSVNKAGNEQAEIEEDDTKQCTDDPETNQDIVEKQREPFLMEVDEESSDPFDDCPESSDKSATEEEEQEPEPEEPTRKRFAKRFGLGKTIWTCGICGYRSDHRFNISRHANKIHGEESEARKTPLASCRRCDYKTILRSKLDRHIRTNHNFSEEEKEEPVRRKAKFSGSSSKQKDTQMKTRKRVLKKVLKRSLGRMMHVCGICDHYSDHQGNLKRHIEKIHHVTSNAEQYMLRRQLKVEKTGRKRPAQLVRRKIHGCHICSFRTNNRPNLDWHIRMKHQELNREDNDLTEQQTECLEDATTVFVEVEELLQKPSTLKEEPVTMEEALEKPPKEIVLQTRTKGRTILTCQYCDYKTNLRNNLNRHIGVKHKDCIVKQEPAATTTESQSEPTTVNVEEQLIKVEPFELEQLFMGEEGDPADPFGGELSENSSQIEQAIKPKSRRKRQKEPKAKKMWHCNICGYQTEKRGNLNRHSNIHNPSVEFAGDVLYTMEEAVEEQKEEEKKEEQDETKEKKQERKVEVEEHGEVHSGGKLLTCLCGYETNRRGNLNRHLRIMSSKYGM